MQEKERHFNIYYDKFKKLCNKLVWHNRAAEERGKHGWKRKLASNCERSYMCWEECASCRHWEATECSHDQILVLRNTCDDSDGWDKRETETGRPVRRLRYLSALICFWSERSAMRMEGEQMNLRACSNLE